MFNLDKAELKKQLKSKIIRIALPGIIDNLVDSLYSHDEFERDIGLIPQ